MRHFFEKAQETAEQDTVTKTNQNEVSSNNLETCFSLMINGLSCYETWADGQLF